MSGIDHKAEAERLAEMVTKAHNTGTLPANTIFALAQVHATLALAEQQRIGNLIAYVSLTAAEFRDAVDHPDEWDAETFGPGKARREAAQQQIREGLGLS